MNELNQQQCEAVEAGDGPVLIVAGPGTGKTKTLTARIAHLVAHGVEPSQILALTFTVKAAHEMSQRVAKLLGAVTVPPISTIHALGYRILQESQPDTEMKFISDAERLSLVRDLLRPVELKPLTARELALAISKHKGTVHGGDDPHMNLMLQRYQEGLLARGLVDFDDLLYRAYHQLQSNPAQRDLWRSRYRYILIDEFQDTSELQWELIGLIRGHDNVFAIGDPKQSIYGFRGASAAMFDRFGQDFPKHRSIALHVNYRSDQAVVALASAVFAGRDALTAHSDQPGAVQAVRTLNESSEADYILSQIEEGIGGSDILRASASGGGDGRSFRDFAVLYRTHQAAKTLQRRLHDSGIPIQIVGEGSPYEQPDVQAIIGALRWFEGREVPSVKGFTAGQVRSLLEAVDRHQSVSRLADAIIQAFLLASTDTARQRLGQFVSTLVRFDERTDGLAACLAYIDEISQGDFYDPHVDAVTLLTIHASKGLEFPCVMLIAAEEGILPHIRKTAPTDFEEEKRLFYVAATRARQRLDIVFASKRMGESREVSRFVQELSQDVLPRRDDPNSAQLQKKMQRRAQKARQATLF